MGMGTGTRERGWDDIKQSKGNVFDKGNEHAR